MQRPTSPNASLPFTEVSVSTACMMQVTLMTRESGAELCCERKGAGLGRDSPGMAYVMAWHMKKQKAAGGSG